MSRKQMRKKKGTIRPKKRGGVKKDKEAAASRKNMKKQNKRISKLAKRHKLSQASKERFASLSEKRQGKAHERNVKVYDEMEMARRERWRQEHADYDLPVEDAEKDNKRLPAFYSRAQHARQARRAREARATPIDSDDEENMPLDMLDPEDDIPWIIEEQYAELRKTMEEKKAKQKELLPIKTAAGRLVERSVEVDENMNADNEELDDEEEGNDEENEENVPKHSTLERCKIEIADMCTALMSSPEKHVHNLKRLLDIAEGNSIVDDATLKYQACKLAVLSLLKVYLDIIPSYAVHDRTDELAPDASGKKKPLKKETRALYEYESALARNYRKYVRFLIRLCSCAKATAPAARQSATAFKLARSAAVAALQLIENAPHFNHTAELVPSVVALCSSKDEEVRRICVRTLCDLYARASKEAPISAIVLQLARKLSEITVACCRLEQQMHKLHQDALLPLTALEIREVDYERKAEKEKKKARKEQLRNLGKKERKHQRALDALEKELSVADARETREQRIKVQTAIMECAFHIYFRLLKHCPRSKLLSIVLRALTKQAHAINVEFLDGILVQLYALVTQRKLNMSDSVACLHCAVCLACGHSELGVNALLVSTINVEPTRFYRLAFELLPAVTKWTLNRQREDYDNRTVSEAWSNLLSAIHTLLVTKRKQVGATRAGAFVKRLCVVALAIDRPDIIVAIMWLVHAVLVAHNGVGVLFHESDESSNSASVMAFQPDTDDPDAGNALLTSVRHELNAIRARARVAPPLTATAAKFAEHMLTYEEWDHKQPARRDLIDRKISEWIDANDDDPPRFAPAVKVAHDTNTLCSTILKQMKQRQK